MKYFLRYLLVNLLLLAGVEYLLFRIADIIFTRSGIQWYLLLQVIGFIVLSIQYPLLIRFKHWGIRSLIFLFGMILGLFVFGAAIAWKDGGNIASGGVLIVVFGMILGFIPLIFIIVVNWLLEKKIYA